MGRPHHVPLPRISRMVAIAQIARVKPRPIPSASMAESITLFLLAYISARPRMMQFTTMSERYTPSDSYRLKAYASRTISTMLTKPAIRTI